MQYEKHGVACDRCRGRVERASRTELREATAGWAVLQLSYQDVEGEEPSALLCPSCAMAVRGALAVGSGLAEFLVPAPTDQVL